jgi:hypothetical protein
LAALTHAQSLEEILVHSTLLRHLHTVRLHLAMEAASVVGHFHALGMSALPA